MHELRRRDIPVIVFEAGKQVAGLATSFRDQDGFRYGVRLTAHVLALGLAGRAAREYLQPWREAVGAAL